MTIEIIGEAEYEGFMHGGILIGSEKHVFHKPFASLLDCRIPRDHSIPLDQWWKPSDMPTTGGIYFCKRSTFCSWDEFWYVGKALNFRERWQKHHKLATLMAIQDVYVCCLPIEASKEEISRLERIYINMLAPVFNDNSRQNDVMRVVS